MSFKVQRVESAVNLVYIRANGIVDPPMAAISTTDNITYTVTADLYVQVVVERNNILIDGLDHKLQRDVAAIDTAIGINLTRRTNVTIRNMEIVGFDFGIYLSQSSNNAVLRNTIKNNGDGISLYISYNNMLSENRITNNQISNGIVLRSSSFNSISENEILGNLNGIALWNRADHNIIWNNNISENTRGIELHSLSNANNISRNNIVSNVDGIFHCQVFNNTIFRNNFIDNYFQVFLQREGVSEWDSDHHSEGNYWSDYTGVDSDHDGIGDTSYTMDAENEDNFPLMGKFYAFNVSMPYPTGGLQQVNVISNSSVSNLELLTWLSSPNEYLQPGQLFIHFVIKGEEGSVGFCRLMIPRVVLNDSYRVLVDWNEVPSTELSISNSTNAYLYFTFIHSTHEVIVIPESKSFLILPLFMIIIFVFIRRKERT